VGVATSLAFASIRRHPARTALAIAGVAVASAMLLDMVMLSSGMGRSFRNLLEGGGFELRLTPRGTLPFDTDATVSGASKVMSVVRSHPEVTAVAPVLGASLHVSASDGRRLRSFGIGVDPEVQGDYEVVRGSDLRGNHDVVASDRFAEFSGARLGDTLDFATGYDAQLRTFSGTRRMVLTGFARFRYIAADQAVIAMPLGTLQEMGGAAREDRASLFMVRLRQGADAESVGRWIESRSAEVTAISTAEAVRLAEQRLSYFRQLALILGSVSFLVALLLVTTLVSVSVSERAGEIAVLRAIGISRVRIVQQVAIEGLVLTLGGAVLGLLLGLATGRWLNGILSEFPGLPADIDFFLFHPSSAWTALGLLVLCGIAAGIYPAHRAASLPIAGTMREEQE
jgi:putative ABC transport system permease protein